MGNPWKITIYHRNTYRKPIYKWAVFPSHASLLKGIIKLDWSYLEFTDFTKKSRKQRFALDIVDKKSINNSKNLLSLCMWNGRELSVLPRLEWREHVQEITLIVFAHCSLETTPKLKSDEDSQEIATNQWTNPKSSKDLSSEKATLENHRES